jgi:hypothetical protein
MRKWIAWGVVGLVGLLILIQFVPYGRNHTNPSVVSQPAWDSTQTHDLAVRACFDCHSNETVWYWYSNIAPFSWLIQRDVDEGRRRLNFSDLGARGAGESAEAVREGSMPPAIYVLLHPSARLSQADKAALEAGLTATFGSRGG